MMVAGSMYMPAAVRGGRSRSGYDAHEKEEAKKRGGKGRERERQDEIRSFVGYERVGELDVVQSETSVFPTAPALMGSSSSNITR